MAEAAPASAVAASGAAVPGWPGFEPQIDTLNARRRALKREESDINKAKKTVRRKRQRLLKWLGDLGEGDLELLLECKRSQREAQREAEEGGGGGDGGAAASHDGEGGEAGE